MYWIFKNRKLKVIALRLLKEGFVSLLMFNSFNIGFAIGVSSRYSPSMPFSQASMYLCIILIVLAIFMLQCTNDKDYGEYKLAFKDDCVCRCYIPMVIVYRIVISIFISYYHDYELGTLLMVGVGMGFVLFNLINLPFKNVFHNYRSNIIYLTHLVTLFTTNYYVSMKSTTPLNVKAHYHTAAILEIVAITLCMVVSFAMVIYTIYKKCRLAKTMNAKEMQMRTNVSELNLGN